jgi:hypothetical protein
MLVSRPGLCLQTVQDHYFSGLSLGLEPGGLGLGLGLGHSKSGLGSDYIALRFNFPSDWGISCNRNWYADGAMSICTAEHRLN